MVFDNVLDKNLLKEFSRDNQLEILKLEQNVVAVYYFGNFDWLNWIFRVLSREQVAALDPAGRWSNLQYFVLLDTIEESEMSETVPYSPDAVLFIIHMKLTHPAQIAAFAYSVSDPQADFSEPIHEHLNLLHILFESKIPEFWHLFCDHARNMPPLRMNDKFVVDLDRLAPEMRESLSKRISK